MPTRPSLGELLVEAGLLDAASLAAAERAARRLHRALVGALVEERLVEPIEILDLLRRTLKLPDIDLERIVIDPEALRLIPFGFAEQHIVLPVDIDRHAGRGVMRVVMADPLDQAAVDEIEFSTGLRVEASLALVTDVAAAVQRHYRAIVTKIIPRHEEPEPPPPPAAETTPPPATGFGPATPAPLTQPLHRLEDEAPPELQVQALLSALVRRGLLSHDEFVEELRTLLKQDHDRE